MAKSDIKAGRAYIELYVNQSQLVKGLQAAQKRLAGLSSSISGISAGFTKAGGVGLAFSGLIAAGLGGAVAAASDLQETMSKFDVVFGDRASAVKEWGDTFAGEVGRSEKQVAGFLAGAQDLFVPLGFEPGAAEEMSKQVTQLAVDLASFNNSTDEAAMNDLQAALTGSGEVMKKYGVIVSEAAVKQEMLNQRLDPKNATEVQKVQARLNIIMRGTTAAQGDAARTSGSFANALKSVRAMISDTAAEIGTALLPDLASLLADVRKVLGGVRDWAKENAGLIVSVAKLVAITAAGSIGLLAIGKGLSLLAGGLSLAASLSGALAAGLVFLASPVGLVTAALALGAVAWLRWTDSGQRAAASIRNTLGNLRGIAEDTIGGIGDALMAGDLELAGRIAVTGLQLALVEGFDAMGTAIGGLWGDTLKGLGQQLAAGDLAGAWQTMLSAMHTMFATWASRVLQGWAATVKQIAASMAMFSQEDADEFEQKELERRDVHLRNLQGALPKIEKDVAEAELVFEVAGTEESAEHLRKLQHLLEITRRAIADLQAGGHGIVVTVEGLTFDPTRGTTNIQDVVQGAIDDMIDRDPLFADLTNTLNAQIAEAEQNLGAAAAGTGDRTAELREQLELLRSQAAEAAERAAAERAARSGAKPGAEEDEEEGPGGFDLAAARNRASVTFSAAAFAAMGQGGGPQERIAKASDELVKLTRAQMREQRSADEKMIRAIETSKPAFT
jgi:hypothetical protein